MNNGTLPVGWSGLGNVAQAIIYVQEGKTMASSKEAKQLTAAALRSVFSTIETRVRYALDRQTAALLTVAAHIAMASASSRDQDLTPVLAKAMVSATFAEFLKP